MDLNRISIRKKKKGSSNSGKCGKGGGGGESPEGEYVDNCGIVDVHWKGVDQFQDCMAARSARLQIK